MCACCFDAFVLACACACLLKLLLRKALSRIHRGEQALYQVAGAELAIHPQLESDLEEFITFIFNAGHGIDWGQIAEYARKLAKAMEIKGFQGSSCCVVGRHTQWQVGYWNNLRYR